MTALLLYAPLLAAAAWAVWRRPVWSLYAFVAGLAVHNLAMALLYGAGVRGAELSAIAAWKEALLAVALASVAARAWRGRRLPFRPGPVDALALAFAATAVVYAVIPQQVLGGEADAAAVAYGLRHALVPVAAYLLGRSLLVDWGELRRLGVAVVAVAGVVAAYGLAEVYLVSLDWWRRSGAVGWYRDQLGLDYGRSLSGLPENFVFNPGDERPVRRLVSTFLSPLATAYALGVALLVAAAWPRLSRLHLLVPVLLAALLFTHSRSAILALAGALVVLAVAGRRRWAIGAAAGLVAVGVAFVAVFPEVGPETRFTAAELEVQRQGAVERPGADHEALDPDEPSLAGHWTNLRDGLETVARHPQGFGLGNAGASAKRTGGPILAGESNYTEIGVETGLAGLALFVAWSVALLVGLLRGPPPAVVVGTALAFVLAVGIQTDAIGVPWLAYVVWTAAGATVVPARLRAWRTRSTPASTSATST